MKPLTRVTGLAPSMASLVFQSPARTSIIRTIPSLAAKRQFSCVSPLRADDNTTSNSASSYMSNAFAKAEAKVREAPQPRRRELPKMRSQTEIFNEMSQANYFANHHADAAQLNKSLPPKMGPTAGRSIAVGPEGVNMAMGRLRMLLLKNNVKSDFMRQRFHERPGVKRKRLKSERHRKRFKAAFKRMVSVILKMKGKGY